MSMDSIQQKTPLASEKSLWERLRAWSRGIKLPHFADRTQRGAFWNIWRFLGLLLVLTILARGTAGATMAKVSLARPYRTEIVESIQITGKVQAARDFSPTVAPGIAIEEIAVFPGQTVAAGDVLAVLNPAEVEELRREQTLVLQDMELELRQLGRAQTHDGTALEAAVAALEEAEAACEADQDALEWAEEDAAFTWERGQAAILQAEFRVMDAEEQLNKARRGYREAQEGERVSDSNTDVVFQGGQSEESGGVYAAPEAAETALEDARTVLRDADLALHEAIAAAAKADESARRALETAQRNLEASQRAKDAAEKKRQRAQAADTETRQEAADSGAQNAIDARMLQLRMEKQKEQLALLDAIGEKGEVFAGMDGTVLAVSQAAVTEEGEAIAAISDERYGFQIVAALSPSQAKELETGAEASVSRKSGYYDSPEVGNATLISLYAQDGADTHTATFQLPEGEWEQGETVSLQIVKNSDAYPLCVPLSALSQDQEGYFVFVLHPSSGVLGVENIVRRTPVSLAADDGELVAVEGMISTEDSVVFQASKPLSDGDKVRVKEQ